MSLIKLLLVAAGFFGVGFADPAVERGIFAVFVVVILVELPGVIGRVVDDDKDCRGAPLACQVG